MPGLAGGGAQRVRGDLERRVRPGIEEPAQGIRPHGGGADRGHEARVAHAGLRRVHDVHARDVRRVRRGAAAHHAVQQVDVQHTGLHAPRAVDQGLAGGRVPAAVELQHDVLRLGEHQVPVRRGFQVRHQSVLPSPGPSPGASRRGPGRRRSSDLETPSPSRTSARFAINYLLAMYAL